MSKLQSRLSRRKQRNRAEEDAAAGKVQVEAEQTLDEGAENISGSKSEIIAQLHRRMKKIEKNSVRALGTKQSSKPNKSNLSFQQAEAEIGIYEGGKNDKSRGDQNNNLHQKENAKSADVEIVREALLPGEPLDTTMGKVWLNRQIYPEYYMGNEPVNRYLATGRALATFAKDHRLAALHPEGALFIDTETTGLSGGAGTLPFLIGVGFFEDGVFAVEQYFCREPAEEPAQLEALANRMATATYLVSFNGKSFDMPLLNTRFIINKVKNPGYNLPHLDLLHVSRRIFKRRLSDRSLQNLERVVLGFTRHGDIPGAEIPDAYRDFLFGHGEDRIAAILEHNLLDIVALAALGGVLDKIYSDPQAVAHVADHLGLAGEAFSAGAFAIGDSHLDAADVGTMGDHKKIALHMKAKTLLQRKRYAEAIDVYLRALDEDSDDVDAHLQLAKLYEHRQKDFDNALYHARQTALLEGEDGMQRRLVRIKKKKEKNAKKKW